MSSPIDPGDGFVSLDATTNAIVGIAGGLLATLTACIYVYQVNNAYIDHSKVETLKLAQLIATGADNFLKSEYKALSGFVVVVAIPLFILDYRTGISFLAGALLSALSGYIGMKIATKANVRTTMACQGPEGLNRGLKVAFKSGAVMALCVVSTALLGVCILYLAFVDEPDTSEEGVDANAVDENVWEYLSGFAFGGSSIALFARVGGGIYTKAADVGADLVGKVEESLAEDSPDNPATIADNVGDNVGDVAGMGADLFESFAGSIIAAATLGAPVYGQAGVALPMWIAGLGAVCSILGTFAIRANSQPGMKSDEVLESLLGSIRLVIYGTSALVVGAVAFALGAVFGFEHDDWWKLGLCVIIGLVAGNAIGYFTEYATSYTYRPTQKIAEKSNTGPATVIIEGLGVGMLSCVPPVIFISAAVLSTYALVGVYGISIAAVGMLSTLGVTLATDAFGPVADNAGGIAEMAPDDEISEEVRETTDSLDALGNTTAATGKGFAIGSAVLTALALMTAFAKAVGITAQEEGGQGVDLLDSVVLPGLLIGALLPYIFGALTMLSVGKAAESIMYECRDQLNKKHFDQLPINPGKCVAICTVASLQEMVIPGAVAVSVPVIIGCLLGPKGLLGMLGGAISSGFLLGVMMSNAGGAWDNAKKYVEKGNLGPDRAKGSDNHKAVVTGDTVGDPFKDTSGPALNILIKLMSIVSLVIAPLLCEEVDGVTIPREKWDLWWIAVIMTVVMIILGLLFNYYVGKFGALHDKVKIDKDARERKGAGGNSLNTGYSAGEVNLDDKGEGNDAPLLSAGYGSY